MSIPPPTRTPVAPSDTTSRSWTRREPPGPRPPDAFPPTTGRPGHRSASHARKSAAGKVNGSATRISAAGSKPRWSGHPSKCQSPPARRVAVNRTGARGPIQPAHRLMAGVSSTSRPVPTTDSAAAPTMARGWSTDPTVWTMSSRAPAWDRVAATITRSGRSPMDSSTDPVTSPTASDATGCSDSALANGTTIRGPAGGSGCRVTGGTCGDRRPGWGPGRRAGRTRCGGCARAREG